MSGAHTRLALWAALSLVGLGAGCSEEAAPPPLLRPVTVAPVLIRDVEVEIEATGELIATNQAQIAAEVAGRVTAIVLDEGALAEAGDALLEIDPERRQLDLANARARLAESRAALREQKRELDRVRKLHGRAVASQSALDQAGTALETARARVAASEAQTAMAERALRDASVVAPFKGSVSRRYVSEGEFVSVGQPLVELVALDPIEVEFHVAEVDSGRVRVGQEAQIALAPYPEELFVGIVTVVAPTIDPATRTLRVRAELENRDGRLRPGLFARVDLGVERREGVRVLPEEAVLRRADGPVIFVVDERGRVKRRKVELGVHEYGEIEVRYGVEPSERVVTRGHSDLADGALVTIRNPDGTVTAPAVASGPNQDGDRSP